MPQRNCQKGIFLLPMKQNFGKWLKDQIDYKSTLRSRGIIIHSLTDKIPEGKFAPVK